MNDWLAYRAKISKNDSAVISPHHRLTYGELAEGVAFLAGQLRGAGIMPGKHVAVLPPNRLETVFAIHALAKIGAVLVPLNLRLKPDTLAAQLRAADCEWLLFTEQDTPVVASLGSVPAIQLTAKPRPPWIEAYVQNKASDVPDLNLPWDQPAAIVFTSGSTAGPRGVQLSHGNLYWSAVASALRLGTNRADRWIACLPLYHVGGLSILYRCTLYGTTAVLIDGFDVELVGSAIRNHRITQISLVPTMLHRFMEDDPMALTEPTLRTVLVGGAGMLPALLTKSLEAKIPLAGTYGLTEAASQVATARPEEVRRKPGSVGKPLMFTQVVVTSEDGAAVDPGVPGEIQVKGPTVMQGYYGQSARNRQILRNGMLKTGDLGYFDIDGDLWVLQKRADLIISGGENVFPAEIEAVLTSHPAVAEACVVGLPDTEWGEALAAAVRLAEGQQATEKDILAFCKKKLAGYQAPKQIVFIDRYPMTGTGKIDREAVLAIFTDKDQ